VQEQVDVWALGISAIEMAEVTPPRWAVHPMRVIFMISREPAPQLADKARWSPAFQSFVSAALQKVHHQPSISICGCQIVHESAVCTDTSCWSRLPSRFEL
jgi:serine/threonine-protein kinase 24/25/MST4